MNDMEQKKKTSAKKADALADEMAGLTHLMDELMPKDAAEHSDTEAVSESEAAQPEAEKKPQDAEAAVSESAQTAIETPKEEEPKAKTASEVAVEQPKKLKKQDGSDSEQKKKKKKRRKKFSYVDVLRGLFPWKGDSVLEGIRKVVFLCSIVVFSVCLYLILDYYTGLKRSEDLYADIEQELMSEMEAQVDLTWHSEIETDVQTGQSYVYYGLSEMGEKLLEMNPEAVGYISIDGTKVSYPIVQRRGDPDSHSANGLLYRSFDGTESKSGCIFLDFRNTFDYVVDGRLAEPTSDNLVLYGHNMNDGSMFGTLKNYKNDYSYYEEHPLITLYSNYRTYTYKIFGFCIVDCEDTTETAFDYWNVLGYNSEEEFYDYVNAVKRRTIRLTNVDVEYGDKLLTLSTCNGMFDTARFVVFARLLREGEDPLEGTQDSVLNDNILWPTIYYRWNSYTYDPDAEFIPYGPEN